MAMLLVACLACLAACGEKSVAVGVTGYNHSGQRPISSYTVNGAMGANLNQHSGGGHRSCCVSIPASWHAGLKARVEWKYDSDPGTPSDPKLYEVTVEVPEYKEAGTFQVHFYDAGKVQVVVSPCYIEHPFYPMSAQERLPWVASGSKEEAVASSKKGGAKIEC